jgi:toxin ParE1/3/4
LLYRLTKRAAEDLRHIYREGKRLFGKEQADLYHQHLHNVFDMLGENPKLARIRTEISPPVRIHPSGPHLIIYVERNGGGILIIRVRHYRENW